MHFEITYETIDWKLPIQDEVDKYYRQLRQLLLTQATIERHRDETQLYSWQKPQELIPLEP